MSADGEQGFLSVETCVPESCARSPPWCFASPLHLLVIWPACDLVLCWYLCAVAFKTGRTEALVFIEWKVLKSAEAIALLFSSHKHYMEKNNRVVYQSETWHLLYKLADDYKTEEFWSFGRLEVIHHLRVNKKEKERKPQNPTFIVIESVQVRLQTLRKRSQESYLAERSINKSPLSNKRDA